jgi:hypothetical protein
MLEHGCASVKPSLLPARIPISANAALPVKSLHYFPFNRAVRHWGGAEPIIDAVMAAGGDAGPTGHQPYCFPAPKLHLTGLRPTFTMTHLTWVLGSQEENGPLSRWSGRLDSARFLVKTLPPGEAFRRGRARLAPAKASGSINDRFFASLKIQVETFARI